MVRCIFSHTDDHMAVFLDISVGILLPRRDDKQRYLYGHTRKSSSQKTDKHRKAKIEFR